MGTFAFLVHPLNIEDVAKKYRIAKRISPKVVGSVLRRRRPFVMAEIEGIQSITGEKAVGWFVVVPLLPWQFYELEEDKVLDKLAKACNVAAKEGAKIVGLGAFTAMPGEGGKKLLGMSSIPVTTGNTYTTATAIQGTEQAMKEMGIEASRATLAVVGATGSIGSACAQVLAKQFTRTLLIGRDSDKLMALTDHLTRLGARQVEFSTDISGSLPQADVVISVTGAVDAIIRPEDIKSGAVVCDVARPRDVSKAVTQVRDDVLVIDGSIVKPPGAVDFHIDFGPPPGMCEGCVGETIILALEERYEPYTIGKNISLARVEEMTSLAAKHGFELAGLRREETLLDAGEIARVKKAVAAKSTD